MKIKNITIGSDPEGWIVNKLTGEPTPITGLLKGSKGEPISFLPGYGYQEDNCSWEFNIPPCKTKEQFIDTFSAALEELESVLDEYILRITPSIEFDSSLLTEKSQVEIGCSEDFNAYTYDVETIPNLAITGKRFAGGHIHIGYNNPNWEKSVLLCKHFDVYLGLLAVLLDNDTERKAIYGTPGRHRIKDYGIEYRTLSNFWIKSPELIALIWDQAIAAIKNCNEIGTLIEMFSEEVTNAIILDDKDLALNLITTLKVIDLDKLNLFINKQVNNKEYVSAECEC
jgi:hypothetical protein